MKRTLFGLMNAYPQKKVITFNKHTDDFPFWVNYAELDHLPSNELENIGYLNLTQVVVAGVGAAFQKHQGENVEHKGIKAHFNMDDSGILNLMNVEFVVEKTVIESESDSTLSKLGSTISKLFGSDTEDQKVEEKPQDLPESEKNLTVNANETVADKHNATEKDDKAKPKTVTLKEHIDAQSESLNIQPLSKETFKVSKAKIDYLNSIDNKRIERETSLNNLEAFVVDTQMKIDMEEYAECGTPDQIDEIRKLCGEVSEWLYEDGYEAATELYKKKLAALQEKANPLLYKHWEHRERPDAVATLRNMLNSSNEFLTMSKNYTKENNPDKDIFTQVEIEVLSKKIEETEDWLNASIDEQNALKKNDDIKLTVDSLREKMAGLDREVKYLINKMKIWRPKKTVKPKNETSNEKVEEVTEKEFQLPEEDEKKIDVGEEEALVEDATTEAPPQLGNANEEHIEL